MQILAELPDIVATKEHPYEIRIAQYWAACYETLSSRADHEHSSRPNYFHRSLGSKWIGANPFNHMWGKPYQKWMKEKYNPELLNFFRDTVERYYQDEAFLYGKKYPKYFAEKAMYIRRGPDWQSPNVLKLLYDEITNIYLVRDPRDILVSQVAFFRKDQDIGLNRTKDIINNLSMLMDKMVEDFKDEEGRIIIRYEEMIHEPKKVVHQLCNELGVEINKNELHQIINMVVSGKKEEHITSGSVNKSIGRGMRELSLEILHYAEEKMKGYIDTFGYNYIDNRDKQ